MSQGGFPLLRITPTNGGGRHASASEHGYQIINKEVNISHDESTCLRIAMQTYPTTDATMCQNVSDIPRILPSFVSRPEIAIAIRKFIQRETMHNRQG